MSTSDRRPLREILEECGIDHLQIPKVLWFYVVIPFAFLFFIQYIHELGHVAAIFITGGEVGAINFGTGGNSPFLLVSFKDPGILPVTLIAGPFIGYVLGIAVERQTWYTGSCATLRTWYKYRAIGVFAITSSLGQAVYTLPIRFHSAHGDGYQLYQYFQSNPLWESVTLLGLNIANPSVILGFVAGVIAIYELVRYIQTSLSVVKEESR